MNRAITVLGLIQIGMILSSFLALGIVMKIFGGHPDFVELTPLTSALREYPVVPLLAPALWICYALWAERVDRGMLSARLSLVVGAIMAAAIPVTFLFAAAFPIKKWLI